MELEPDDQRLLDRAIELLADSPRRIDELTRLLLDEGAFDFMGPEAADGADGAGDGDLLEEYAEYLDEVLLTSDDTWGSDTGLVGSIPQVMSGRQFTHRLTADERTNHAVVASPDLEVIDFDIGYRHTTLQLAGGGSLRVVLGELPSPQTMTGPTGWLDGFSAGDLLCFTRQG